MGERGAESGTASARGPDGWSAHDAEQRRSWQATTAQERLAWLEDAKRFVARAMEAARPRGSGESGGGPGGGSTAGA